MRELLRNASIRGFISSIKWIGHRWYLVCLACLVDLLSAGGDLGIPWSMKLLVDGASGLGSGNLLIQACLVLAASGAAKIFAGFISAYLYTFTAEKSAVELRAAVVESILSASPLNLRYRRSGDLLSRVLTDCSALQQLFGETLVSLMTNLVRTIGFSAIMFWINPRIALIALPFAFFAAILLAIGALPVKRAAMRVQEGFSQATAELEETVGAAEEIQLLNAQAAVRQNLKRSFSHIATMRLKQAIIENTLAGIAGCLIFSCLVAVVWVGGNSVKNGVMTLGELIALISYASNAFSPMRGLLQAVGQMLRAMGAGERIRDFSREMQENPLRDGSLVLRDKIKNVSISKVGFNYPSSNSLVIKDTSLSVNAGEIVAIIGSNGTGKSTLLGLIPRLYDPTSGSIKINGSPIEEISIQSLRRRVALIGRTAFLIRGNLAENVLLGCPSAANEQIHEALRLANAEQLIDKLGGLQGELIGSGGRPLSSGERQKIAMARLFLRRPDVIILDEALSSIDTESREHIYKNIYDSGALAFLVTHDFQSLPSSFKRVSLEKCSDYIAK